MTTPDYIMVAGRNKLIGHLHGVEQALLESIAREQVRHLSKREIRQLYPDGTYPAERLKLARTPSPGPALIEKWIL